MKKRTLVIGLVAVLVVGGVAAVKLGYLSFDGAVAQAPRPTGPRVVPVDVAIAQKKKVPVRVDLLGTVTPIASVAVKTRIDSEIVGVHFRDGATVRAGDLLFTMDGRAIEAQIRQGALDMIIFEELVYQETQRQKLTISAARMSEMTTAVCASPKRKRCLSSTFPPMATWRRPRARRP